MRFGHFDDDRREYVIQPRRYLLDMGGLSSAVVTGNHHTTVFRESRENRQGGRLVEAIVGIDIRSMLVRLRICRNLHVAFDAEQLADRDLHIGEAGGLFCYGRHSSSLISDDREPCLLDRRYGWRHHESSRTAPRRGSRGWAYIAI